PRTEGAAEAPGKKRNTFKVFVQRLPLGFRLPLRRMRVKHFLPRRRNLEFGLVVCQASGGIFLADRIALSQSSQELIHAYSTYWRVRASPGKRRFPKASYDLTVQARVA